MTMENNKVIEGNKLIAEFMGAVLKKDDYGLLGYFYEPDNTPTKHSSCWWNDDELRYHLDWDWLMPVIRKILVTWIPENGIWPYEYTHLQQTGLGQSIEEVHSRVVQFIQWYNSQTTSKQ